MVAAPPGAHAQERIALSSSSFLSGGRLPLRAAAARCGGGNVSPELRWRGAPPSTRSFAVTVFDPDARAGAGFWHWIVYDIPATVSELVPSKDGTLLPRHALSGTNDIGTRRYYGPCPPRGELHHYRFTIYALRTSFVPAPPGRRAPTIVDRLTPYLLARGTLLGTYQR